MAAGPWLAGAALAFVLLGPVLGPGPLLTLDLVLLDPTPVPRGVWGLGPELPRRVPLWLPVAWLAPLVSSELLGKVLMAASITVAFVGARRLTTSLLSAARRGPPPAGTGWLAAGAGVLYAASPFLLTRLAVGHLMIAVPAAVLPWALPHLLRPHRSLARTFLAALALAAAGHAGGLYAVIVVAAGLAVPGASTGGVGRARAVLDVVAVVALAQLPWLVPGLLVGAAAATTDAAPFSTEMDGLGGLLGLAVGHGFWQPYYQIGQSAPAAVIGALVAGLALVGGFDLPGRLRAAFAVLAAVGLGGAAASAIPGVRDGLAVVTGMPGLGVLRESQRLLVLALVVVAPCAALGAARLARSAARLAGGATRPALAGAIGGALSASVLLAAVVLALPAVGGIDPRLAPVDAPAEWAQVQEIVGAAPGTVLALPWHQYFDMAPGSGRERRVLHPAPFLLGGDVLTSSDPELEQAERRERLDPREATGDAIVAAAERGEPVSDRLAALGVRWVLALHEVDWQDASGIGAGDAGLRPALRAPTLDLWEVRSWPGLAPGAADAADPLVEPLVLVPPEATALNRPYAPGWLRGLRPVREGPGGIIALPEGGGPVWYWPALLVLVADGLALAGTIYAVRAVRAGRPADSGEELDGASTFSGVDRAEGGEHSLLDAGPPLY